MKKKICKLSAAVLLFFSGIMEIGWRFFNMVVCCKRGGRKKERNGLNYPIYGIIIPETDMQRNMMRAGHGARLRRCRTVISRAWMD
mgnify:FL=1